MIATKEAHAVPFGSAMECAVSKKKTLVVRIHEDVAMLADKLAPAFDRSTPDFLSDILRPILEGMKAEAADKIINFPLGDDAVDKRRRKTK